MNTVTHALLLLLSALTPSPPADARLLVPIEDPLLVRVSEAIEAAEGYAIALRHDIHRHPELARQETRTAAAVASRLRALGLDVRENVGGTGVVGVLRGARPGPTVAYRADMDATRSSDPDPAEPRSEVPGVRHQCGHDVHVAVAVALASGLAAVRDSLPGTVVFVFQPAEEPGTGARAMLADGLFDRERPAAIYGVHSAPFETGTLATRPGPMMPAIDGVRFVLAGSGDIAAAEQAVRALASTASTITQAQMQQSVPHDFSLVTVGRAAVRADATVINGAVRLAGAATRARVRAALEEGVRSIAVPGVTIAVEYSPMDLAGVTNDDATTQRAVTTLTAAYGSDAVREYRALIPGFSEDFGAFQESIPGTFFFLGVSNAAKGIVGMPHTPNFAADDAAIAFGARAMAVVLLDRLSSSER